MESGHHRYESVLMSPSGVQDLAGNCMTIMAIGEGFRKIDKIPKDNFWLFVPKSLGIKSSD